MKSFFISTIILSTMNSFALPQSRDFIAGTMIGFYGVHINGEISDFYLKQGLPTQD